MKYKKADGIVNYYIPAPSDDIAEYEDFLLHIQRFRHLEMHDTVKSRYVNYVEKDRCDASCNDN